METPGRILDMQEKRRTVEHKPVRVYPLGKFSDPPGLHDDGRVVGTCSCGAVVEDPTIRGALIELARHTEEVPSFVANRAIWNAP